MKNDLLHRLKTNIEAFSIEDLQIIESLYSGPPRDDNRWSMSYEVYHIACHRLYYLRTTPPVYPDLAAMEFRSSPDCHTTTSDAVRLRTD